MTRRSIAITSLLLAAFAIVPARAHEAPMTSDQIVRASHSIIVARVVSAVAHWNPQHSFILTHYTLDVESILAGEVPARVEFDVFGGTLGGETQETCVTVQLDAGARYLLFMRDPSLHEFSTFTAAHMGVFREEFDADGKSRVRSGSSMPVEGPGGATPTFDQFVAAMRDFVGSVLASPAPADPFPRALETPPPMPSKTYSPMTPASFEFGVPAARELETGPKEPHHPVLTPADAKKEGEIGGDRYVVPHHANRYIVWNQLPSSWTPWSPHDQYAMTRWNNYGDINRISGSPTGTWAWQNGVFDETGWPSNADMQAQFGYTWGSTTLAITFSRWNGSNIILESDISMNPAYGWTVDENVATDDTSSTWGYDQTVLHELGHGWGLAHPWETQNVWWDSVMNYSPKQMRWAQLFADDTNAVRNTYPGATQHDGLISLYQTNDAANDNNAAYSDTYPNGRYVQQMSTFRFNQNFKFENVGTDNFVNPQVEVYLNANRMSWNWYWYLTTLSYSFTSAPWGIWYLDAGSIYIPYNTPPGDYYVTLYLRDNSDAYTYNNTAWGRVTYDILTVLSYPWMIYPVTYWQNQNSQTGPNGYYTFYFDAVAGQRYDFSLCPADGGSASYDTTLEILDPYGFDVGYNDDYCGLQSRVSFIAPVTDRYHVKLAGYRGAYGTFALRYRTRTFADSVLWQTLAADHVNGNVVINWSGDVGPYDLQRATSPDFSDAVYVLQDGAPTTYNDPVLNDGVNYYYRVR